MRYCKIQYDLSVSILPGFISRWFPTTKILDFELPLANGERENTSTYMSTTLLLLLVSSANSPRVNSTLLMAPVLIPEEYPLVTSYHLDLTPFTTILWT